MRRRALVVVAFLLGWAGGYLAGDTPDRELRQEAKATAATSAELARSCRRVLTRNLYLAARATARADALLGPYETATSGGSPAAP